MSDESPAPSPPGPLPSPWALWTVFYDFPQWFLARGYPPTLCDPRRWVRAMRVTVLIAIHTMLAAWMIAVMATVFEPSDNEWYWLCGLGAPLGALVLLPMSRWMGRSWGLAICALPVAGAAILLQFVVAQSNWIGDWVDGEAQQRGITFGLVLAVGMLGFWPPRCWLLVLLCTASSVVAWSWNQAIVDVTRQAARSIIPSGIWLEILCTAPQFIILFCATTLPLGIWLWDPPRE